ncbi:MAG: FAD-dependent oxidoreductase [Alphaproteobacteria bacterium]|nr:FAD-dependent oxidoreductase [Alphaproteobacteria bacterium]MDE2630028.1 FAD-dependent oxidoreductase [Alphaproteobacteria bacterium]
MVKNIVIAGAGQAGAQAVFTLRAEGFSGAVTMIGEEPFAPYQRPPLSKAYLLGTFERDRLFLKPDAFYRESACELILGVGVRAIDRKAKAVALSDGRSLPYDRLLLATGTRVRPIRCPGAELAGIHYLRGIADVDRLRPALRKGKRLAVVGGGYIGLEVAAVAVKHGLDVTVFEAMSRVMARAVSRPVSAFFERLHRAAGVKLLLNTGVAAFEGSGRLEAVKAEGKSYPADLALVGIGVIPNMEIARNAGLPCEDGIVVDGNCASPADPAIFAAGDCTWHVGREGIALRLESVQNAIDQAKHAAYAMAGRPRPYREVPWFWSDQYDVKLQIAGLARGGDRIVLRGDLASRKFAAFHLRDGAVAAVEAVNAPSEYLVGRKLIAGGTRVAPERLADASVPMKNIV